MKKKRRSTKSQAKEVDNKKKVKEVESNDNEELPCCYESEQCPIQARSYLKKKFFQHNNQFYLEEFLTEQERQLSSVIDQCVKFGESNSVLVIGPRGSGKSKLVEKVITDISKDADDTYFYVYLSGIIHTDDRTALQDMARQLQLENVVGDRVFGSFADNLSFLLDALKQDTGKSKSIIMVLDEFDLFANHKNQSLLYNLFDIAQSRQNPLCVIGITCRLDVVELLEKRVKSRYSHRSILTFPAYTFSSYLNIYQQLLDLSENFDCAVFKTRWRRHVEELLNDGLSVKTLQQQFNIRKDIGSIIQLLISPTCSISGSHKFITADDLLQSYSNIHMDTKAAVLNGLSILELTLVIAAKHVLNRRDNQPFNFEMLHNEYQTFSRRRLAGMQTYTKPVAFKAYEHLIALELFKCTEVFTQNSSAKEYKPMCMLVEVSQIQHALQHYPECPTELKNWSDSMFA